MACNASDETLAGFRRGADTKEPKLSAAPEADAAELGKAASRRRSRRG